ncbi:MAG: tetratricopeptide repeat protein, partial [Thermoplasmata archaeon]|nr:tetratricopeptide repeat protein [Thermoplasmata archaeon]
MSEIDVEMGPIVPHADMITVKDKILLHLMDFSPERFLSHDWESHEQIIESMPIELTQEGIAKAVGIKWTHVSRALKEFEMHGIMISKKANIEGVDKRRNIYFLNMRGMEVARLRQEQIHDMTLNSVYHGERIRARVSELREMVDEGLSVLDLVRDINVPSTDILDIDEQVSLVRRMEEKRALPFVVQTEGLPTPRHFFGREREISIIDGHIERACRVVVIQGIAGIGKSSLAYKMIERYGSTRNVFYYRFHEWDTYRAVLTPLTEFLHKLGRDNLRRYLRSKRKVSSVEEEHIAIDLYEIFELVSKDFQDLDGILIFDDLHKIEDKMGGLMNLFLEVFERHGGPNVIVLTRNIPMFYTSKDIISERVKEVRLMGLDIESTGMLLKAKGLEVRDLDMIYEATGGHPLSIELMRDPFDLVKPSELRRFIQREMLSKLEPEERAFLAKLAIFRIPVLPEAFIQSTADYDILERLINQILVEEITYSGYKVHELIREFLITTLAREELSDLHLGAANYYLRSEGPEATIEAIHHFINGGEKSRAAEVAVKSGRSLILGGYLEELNNTLDIDSEEVPRRLRAEYMLMCADIQMALNRYDAAEERYNEAIRWAADENPRVLASSLLNIGKIHYERADWEGALDNFKRSVDISENIGDHVLIGDTYRSIGNVHWRKGDSDRATEHFEIALEHAKRTGDLQLQSDIYVDMANNIRHTEMERAIELYKMAVENFIKLGSSYALARVYN